ncbi:hypothetical protein LK994_11785 [Ferruginibacter lapsinanis]|uniref:hypothetical protein n=1 Tax=Ferruginibacter lapsinanis TaxID=563172 RepID=UPI001E32FB4F|nr:hypothetical protein [Ferruginibacter lapsinanis]UEG49313.1 hypothetical protein LK994_11785 [Ferruginibacter lapsinanis]
MRKIFLFFLLFIGTLSVMAQKTKKERKEERRQRINALIKQDEEGVIAYHKHTVYGLKLTTDGYGLFFETGRARSVKKATLFQFEITERKHPKEEKQSNPYVSTIPYVYGKQNFVYNIKLGVQQQILLGNKSNKNGVSVTANYGGGVNIGLLRPYYVQVISSPTSTEFVKYNSPDSALFLNNGAIIGGPDFGKGWGEIKINPGAYVKAGFRFDYGKFNEMVNAVELGLTAEVYSKKLEQMVYVEQKQFFFGAYVGIMFGRRK